MVSAMLMAVLCVVHVTRESADQLLVEILCVVRIVLVEQMMWFQEEKDVVLVGVSMVSAILMVGLCAVHVTRESADQLLVEILCVVKTATMEQPMWFQEERDVVLIIVSKVSAMIMAGLCAVHVEKECADQQQVKINCVVKIATVEQPMWFLVEKDVVLVSVSMVSAMLMEGLCAVHVDKECADQQQVKINCVVKIATVEQTQ